MTTSLGGERPSHRMTFSFAGICRSMNSACFERESPDEGRVTPTRRFVVTIIDIVRVIESLVFGEDEREDRGATG